MRRRGSALILVLIVTAAVITIAFSTQRLALVQFSQSNAEEDNLFAYYAAKAGIEDGLLRFRFERDVETASGTVYRHNITDGKSAGEVADITPVTQDGTYGPTKQYYDLSITFREDRLGLSDINNSFVLEKDASLVLTGFTKSSNYFLRYQFKFICPPGVTEKPFVQIEKIAEPSSSTNPAAFRQIRSVSPVVAGGQVDSVTDGNGNIAITELGTLASTVRFRPHYCSAKYYIHTTSDRTSANERPDIKFDGNRSYISSTGYYGKAKRTLLAEVDRQNGTLLQVYDFNLYAGNSIRP